METEFGAKTYGVLQFRRCPVSGETRYFVYTRWESEEAFQKWVSSPAFQHGHAQSSQASGQAPVGTGSALLSFEVVERVG